MRVPFDYSRPAAGDISIPVVRIPATGATRGVLVMNPGGPGESGVQLAPVVDALLPAGVRQHYALVSFDERGTGSARPVACGTDPAAVTSASPGSQSSGGRPPVTAVYAAMGAACRRRAGALIGQVGTVDAARDLNQLRRALGIARLDYLGLSYGTVLGVVFASMFPAHVRAMILDGAVDPTESLTAQARDEAPAMDRSLTHLLATCRAAPVCPLGPNPSLAFGALSAALARHPLPAPAHSPYPVTVGDLDAATFAAIALPVLAASWEAAVVAAAHGNGGPLRQLALSSEEDLNGQSLVDPQWAIACGDAAFHPSSAAVDALASSLQAKAPPLGAEAAAVDAAGCVGWPAANHPVSRLAVLGTPPLLVLSNQGDPVTPPVWAHRLVTHLARSTIVTWDGWGHTWLLNGSGDPCMASVVTRYLNDPGAPPATTTCP